MSWQRETLQGAAHVVEGAVLRGDEQPRHPHLQGLRDVVETAELDIFGGHHFHAVAVGGQFQGNAFLQAPGDENLLEGIARLAVVAGDCRAGGG